MNLNKLMKQAQKMQEKMTQAQAELAEKTVEVQAAGGKITVVATKSRRRLLIQRMWNFWKTQC